MSIFKRLFGKDQPIQQPEIPDQPEKTKSNPETSIPIDVQEEAIISQSPEPKIEEQVFDVKYSELSNFDKRTIRVFISSTFRDMIEDRNALMTHCWPELRRFCRERQVELVEVDLRWGIAEEQSTRKETLKLCLDEIRACRPFFIGLLGERYGWVPDDDAYTADLKEEQPWLKSIKGKSVTELEILHGVLNNPEMAGRAFFYFRDPKYVETVPKEKKADFLSETDADAEKQTELKNLIRKTCTEKSIPLKETYSDPQSLAALVLEHIKNAIETQFPIEDIPDPLTREARDHEAFAESRRRTYIGRPDYFDALDKHCSEIGKPLVLLGDSGSGKSSLIANWVEHWRKAHPNDFIFQHYIGGTPDGAVHWKLMSRLMAEIKRWTDDPEELPKTNDDILRDFPLWLSKAPIMAEHKGVRFVVVLDALNQLEDKDHGRLLGWLPEDPFPSALRLIVSTLPGDTLEVLEKRDWPTHQIQPLTKDERSRMIIDYLARFSKKLDVPRLERLSAEPAASNPLYLKILLDELRVTGTHEKLDERLNDYLSAIDIPTLLQRVLARYQHDYEYDRKGLVSEALGLIWAARRGLTETELLQLLRPAHLPQLPLATWAPLRSALEEGLLDRGGILNFAHNFLHIAVEVAFLSDLDKKDGYRIQLADYFEALPPTKRSCDELPWLLWQAKLFERLRHCLLNIDRFLEIRDRDQDELLTYWIYLNEERSMGKLYLDSFNSWLTQQGTTNERISIVAYHLGFFLFHAALNVEAEPLMRRALQIDENNLGKDHPYIAIKLNALAGLLQHTNRMDEAEPLMRRALQIDENSFGKDHPSLTYPLNNLTGLLVATNRMGEAEPLVRRALQIDEISFGKDHPNVAIDLNNLAQLLKTTNRMGEAEPLMRRALQIDENSFGKDHPKVARHLSNLAQLLQATNRMTEAEQHMRRALQIDENSFGKDHPNVAIRLNNLALLLQDTNRISEAEPLIRRALQIDEKCFGKYHPIVATNLNNLAQLLQDTNCMDEAEPLMRRALQINENSFGKDHPNVAICFNIIADLLQATNRMVEAEPLMRRALQIDENSFGKDHPKIALDLNYLSQLLQTTNRMSEAELLIRRSLQIDEKSFGENHPNVAIRLNSLAQLLIATNRIGEAEPLNQRACIIFNNYTGTNGHPHPYQQTVVSNYSDLLQKMGLSKAQFMSQMKKVAPEYFKQELIAAQKNQLITPQQIDSIAMELYKIGDYEDAKVALEILTTTSFQVQSTHVHLIRVCILLNQMEYAVEHLELAWQKRTEAPKYVIARIIWFKVAIALLNKTSLENYLGQLNMVLQNEDAFMEWTMEPVLDHLKPKVALEQHALLSALVDAMSFKENLDKLNDFQEWRDAKPEEIE